ncbi:MAG: hypothetical protein CSA33_05340 [Desulfobulbus propionicus]|nr:MAG: hypothetical protein CSA33_05340 [Desulfobulbus propionicus]
MGRAIDKNLPGHVKLPRQAVSGGPDNFCHVYLGTCGYSYTEWTDSGYYPPGTRASDMLKLYCRNFSMVELNYTWYQMARADAMARMVGKAPSHFLFCAKVTRTMTHEVRRNWQEQLKLFRTGIAPLRDQLLALLVQFPPSFERTIKHRQYLAALLDGLQGLPIAVEFRHRSWAVDSVFAELEKRKITLVNVDAPEMPNLFPPLKTVTTPSLFYVRFHGRNTEGWRSTNMQKKFNYNYAEEELHQWTEEYILPMSKQAEKGVIVFNNHVKAQAPRNGSTLAGILNKHQAGAV